MRGSGVGDWGEAMKTADKLVLFDSFNFGCIDVEAFDFSLLMCYRLCFSE